MTKADVERILKLRCPSCGWEFDIHVPPHASNKEVYGPSRKWFCPHCAEPSVSRRGKSE